MTILHLTDDTHASTNELIYVYSIFLTSEPKQLQWLIYFPLNSSFFSLLTDNRTVIDFQYFVQRVKVTQEDKNSDHGSS